MKKLLALSTMLLILGLGLVAKAGYVPLVSGPVELSQATLNQIIQSINGNLGAVSATSVAVATATGTGEQTMASYTIPGTLLQAGSTLRQTCWGVRANNGNVVTAKLYFGAQSASLVVVASAATQWLMRATTIVSSIGASPTNVTLFESVNTTVAPVILSSPGTDNVAAGAVVAKCTITDGTSSASDGTMQGYLAEIVH